MQCLKAEATLYIDEKSFKFGSTTCCHHNSSLVKYLQKTFPESQLRCRRPFDHFVGTFAMDHGGRGGTMQQHGSSTLQSCYRAERTRVVANGYMQRMLQFWMPRVLPTLTFLCNRRLDDWMGEENGGRSLNLNSKSLEPDS